MKRYALEFDKAAGGRFMAESETGDYVLYSDASQSAERVRELEEALQTTRGEQGGFPVHIASELYAATVFLWKSDGNPENWTAANKEAIHKYKAGIKQVMHAMELYETYIKSAKASLHE